MHSYVAVAAVVDLYLNNMYLLHDAALKLATVLLSTCVFKFHNENIASTRH